MNILAIEASSDACSCALLAAGSPVRELTRVAPRRHTELMLPMVHELLEQQGLALSQVHCIAYGCGPGSFTGVRIAACAAQGLALATGARVMPVSTLAALAVRGGAPGESVLACLDARMGEIYLGTFRLDAGGLPVAAAPEQLAAPDQAQLPGTGVWSGVGSGWRIHGRTLGARMAGRLLQVRDQVLPGAAEVARVAAAQPGAGQAPAQALPAYLRRQVATPRTAPLVPD